MTRCWALSEKFGRCEKNAGHDGEHSVTWTWDDDACWLPSMTTTGAADVPIVHVSIDDEPIAKDRCYTCGCSEAAHGGIGDMCEKHQCKTFLA